MTSSLQAGLTGHLKRTRKDPSYWKVIFQEGYEGLFAAARRVCGRGQRVNPDELVNDFYVYCGSNSPKIEDTRHFAAYAMVRWRHQVYRRINEEGRACHEMPRYHYFLNAKQCTESAAEWDAEDVRRQVEALREVSSLQAAIVEFLMAGRTLEFCADELEVPLWRVQAEWTRARRWFREKRRHEAGMTKDGRG